MFYKGKNPESYMHLSKRPLKCLYIYIFFAIKRSNPQVLGVRHKTLRFRFHSHTFLFLELTDASKIIACLSVNLIVSLSEYSLTEIAHHVMLFLEKYYILMCCITLVMTNYILLHRLTNPLL